MFEANLKAMTESIRRSNPRKVAALLAPKAEHERATHDAATKAGTSCACRVCYWARGR